MNNDCAMRVTQGAHVKLAAGPDEWSGAAAPEYLVPFLDRSAYITGLYAMYWHGWVMPAPPAITCFTARRLARARVRKTPFGPITFVPIAEPVYALPVNGVIASGERAFCDFAHLCRRRRLACPPASSLNLDRLDLPAFAQELVRYTPDVRRAAVRLLQSFIDGGRVR